MKGLILPERHCAVASEEVGLPKLSGSRGAASEFLFPLNGVAIVKWENAAAYK